MTATAASTIRQIVADDFRAAGVLHRYAIDFCSNGERSLQEACRERGIDPAIVLEEVAAVCTDARPGGPRFCTWDAETLVRYVVANHHAYVRDAIPPLREHMEKVAAAHGGRHPELRRVAELFAQVSDELASHLHKEERILFPSIVALSAAVRAGQPAPVSPFGTLGNPIRVMETEHDAALSGLAEIRRLTDACHLTDDACATWKVCLQELQAFETDLHVHVHLENDVLFPKVLRLEAGV